MKVNKRTFSGPTFIRKDLPAVLELASYRFPTYVRSTIPTMHIVARRYLYQGITQEGESYDSKDTKFLTASRLTNNTVPEEFVKKTAILSNSLTTFNAAIMEPAGVAAFYGVETAVEGAAAAALVVKKPTMPLRGRWRKISAGKSLPRSSHTLSMVKGKAYIFGGEERPREPVDNVMHVITMPAAGTEEADHTTIEDDPSKAPPPRVGHTAAVISDRIYVFGGRGGKDMAPLDEKGRVWVFDTVISKWSHIDPMPETPYPAARSYHCSTSSIHPLPSPAAHEAGAAAVAPHGSVFIHGGCPASGRLADVWCFDVASATWAPLPDAPEPARGGASLAFARNRLWRHGGFDGKGEIGGQVDYLRIAKATFDDSHTKQAAEIATIPETDKWEMIVTNGTEEIAPGPRSVAGLHPITTGQGRNYILCLLGEKDPSSNGHEAAGQFWSDVWSFQIQPTGMTGASFKDAARQLVGAKTAENTWAPVDVPEYSKTEGHAEHPGPRGWFASACDADFDPMSVVVWGGINAENQRLGDGWIFTVD